MKKLFLTISLLLIVLAVGFGCSRASAPTPAPTPTPAPMPAPRPPAAPGSGGFAADRSVSVQESQSAERRVVKTGSITLEVGSVVETADKIDKLAVEMGGYVVSSRKFEGEEGRTSGSVSIRVPSDKFDEAFVRLRQLAKKAPLENKDSRDITEEYTDLQSQLRSLQATEAQYLELLKRAQKVDEVLNVYQQLSNVQRQIEQLKGRIQYLERTSDMALISIELREGQTIAQSGWEVFGTLASAVRGLLSFLRFLADVAIYVAVFSPLWVPPLVIFIRRRRKKAKA